MKKRIITALAAMLFSVTITSNAIAAEAKAFTLTSTGLSNGATMPKTYTCDGNNTSPPLTWNDAPAKTASLALIVYDPDAKNGFYHWVLYNIPATANALSSALPTGTMTGLNSANKAGYYGACPPPGNPHHYIFTLYALDKKLDLPDHADAQAVQQAMGSNVLQQAQFTLMYGR